MRGLVATLIVLLGVSISRGDGLPGAGSPANARWRGESHGYLAIPITDPVGGGAIVHLPPRRAAGAATSSDDVAEGGVRLALRLPQLPERLAAWGDELWIVFPPESMGVRRVLSLTVERGALGGSWTSPEAEGRLPSLPLLPPGDLGGFVGSSAGPIALLFDGSGRPTLLACEREGWMPVRLPASVLEVPNRDRQRLWLTVSPDGLMLISDDPSLLWLGRIQNASASDGAPLKVVEWRLSPISFVRADGSRAPSIADAPVMAGAHLVYPAWGADGSLRLWNPSAEICRPLATIAGVRGPAALVPLDQVGRVAVAWLEAAANQPRSLPVPQTRGPTLQIAEVSVLTGSLLYRGPAQVAGPVSATELKALAVVLVLVMAIVLLIVLKPEPVGVELSLPQGYALAEPGRRLLAAAADLAVALLITAVIERVPLRELLSPGLVFSTPGGTQSIGVVIGAGLVHSTLAEWLLGASLGKLATGCRVVRVVRGPQTDSQPVARGPGLWRAFVRNAIRWALPPVAIAGLNTPDHRHRGDLAAGTVVVVPIAAS